MVQHMTGLYGRGDLRGNHGCHVMVWWYGDGCFIYIILFFVLGCGFEQDEATESDGVACRVKIGRASCRERV